MGWAGAEKETILAKDTREQLLDAASKLFAEKGFYGASIANIADELGLTKQALLHHFGSKEKLYGEVLARISERMDALVASARAASPEPRAQLEHLLLTLLERAQQETDETRLLMRELLDNKRRVGQAGAWYLRSFLDALIDMALGGAEADAKARGAALAEIYALLGALNYFAISEPTLRGMLGAPVYEGTRAAFAPLMRRLLRAGDDA